MQQTNNKTIAKNTMMLYVRMILTIIVTLYTSRVIFNVLGVEDYGLYQAVGGIVGFLAFINNALAGGSSRFLTFALGKNDKERFELTFSTTLTIHIVLAVIIAILGETIGLWFMYNKLQIPVERMDAALYVFHLSIITAIFTITQVPYNATIIAHERMNIYAYVTIVEAFLKLGIVYMLYIDGIDKLMMYATFLLMIQVGMMVFYRVYVKRAFEGTEYHLSLYDKSLLKEIASYSGWSIVGNGSIALNSHGILIILNLFFGSAIVAARSIALQVYHVAIHFVTNFRTAVNPQIVKKYAAGDFEGSKSLALSSTKYSYYLMWVMCLPIFFGAEKILTIWLGIVPEYAVIFLKLIVFQGLVATINISLMAPLTAAGRLKENALTSPLVSLSKFVVVYYLFRLGFDPVTLSWATIVSEAVMGIIIKPILIHRIVKYSYSEIMSVILRCFIVSICSMPLPLIALFWVDLSTVEGVLLMAIICALNSVVAISYVGIDKETREKVISLVKKKLCKRS